MEEEIKFLAVPMYLLQSDDTAGRGVREDNIMEKLEFGKAGGGDRVAKGSRVPGREGKGGRRGVEPRGQKAITHSTGHQPQRSGA